MNFRYELRRYHHGTRDKGFGPAYSTAEHAAEVAHNYADGAEPGTTIEVWDAETGETLTIVWLSPGAAADRERGGDADQVPGLPGEQVLADHTAVGADPQPGPLVGVALRNLRMLPRPGDGDGEPG